MQRYIPFLICCYILAVAMIPGSADAGQLTRFTFTEYHMGCDTRLTVYAKDNTRAEKACIAAFARIAQLDSIMSDYQVRSELNRLCAKAGGSPVKVSSDLFSVLNTSLVLARASNGAFDITVSPVIQIWRKARKTKELPATADIAAARMLVDYRNVILNPKNSTVQLKKIGMKIDLGGIGKGYAEGEAMKVLRKYGIYNAMIEMGGNITVSGPPPGERGWKIEVPNASEIQGPLVMTFNNTSISTSGDTEQYVELGGKHYSHIVDPRTGWAMTTRVQATVICADATLADALSTLYCVASEHEALALRKRFPKASVYLKRLNTP